MSTQITKTTAEAKRDAWLGAEDAVVTGATYSIGGRSLTRVDLPNIRAAINYWSKVVDEFNTVATVSRALNHGFRTADFRSNGCS
jgi:hypothetical protein